MEAIEMKKKKGNTGNRKKKAFEREESDNDPRRLVRQYRRKRFDRKIKRKLEAVFEIRFTFVIYRDCICLKEFNGVPAEERLHWRSFLVKLGAENLKGVKNEELLVACHKSVYIVYTMLGDVSIFLVGKDEYDELALAEAIFVITAAVKDICGKPPTERLFLDKYGRICLCLDEIVWNGLLENTDNDRIKRLIRLKPPSEF